MHLRRCNAERPVYALSLEVLPGVPGAREHVVAPVWGAFVALLPLGSPTQDLLPELRVDRDCPGLRFLFDYRLRYDHIRAGKILPP